MPKFYILYFKKKSFILPVLIWKKIKISLVLKKFSKTRDMCVSRQTRFETYMSRENNTSRHTRQYMSQVLMGFFKDYDVFVPHMLKRV